MTKKELIDYVVSNDKTFVDSSFAIGEMKSGSVYMLEVSYNGYTKYEAVVRQGKSVYFLPMTSEEKVHEDVYENWELDQYDLHYLISYYHQNKEQILKDFYLEELKTLYDLYELVIIPK